jgi:hypothetical protein
VEPCDPKMKAGFDYSRLDPAFSGLARPAQRALVNAGLFTLAALAKRRRADVAKLHGIGPTVLLRLDEILRGASLDFRD